MYLGQQLPKLREKKTKIPSVDAEDYIEFLLKISKSNIQKNVSLIESKTRIELDEIEKIELEAAASPTLTQGVQTSALGEVEQLEVLSTEKVDVHKTERSMKKENKEENLSRENSKSKFEAIIATFRKIFSIRRR